MLDGRNGGRLLLESTRVLDVGGAESDGVGRLLADLGADVLKVEPPGGCSARHALPAVAGASVAFAVNNANKRSTVLDADCANDRATFVELAESADIVIDSGVPGTASAYGAPCAELARRFGHLVALSVTDFGAGGPYVGRQATDAVLYAMSTSLSRTGPTRGTPVLPPEGVASATAAVQAAWAVLAAYYRRLRDGVGDYIDFSRFEGVAQSLDPPFGSEGQASVGLKRTSDIWRGRPRNQQIYPIFGCKDGHVRICLLSPKQWRGMRGWLGEPERFADPKFDTIAARYAASEELNAAIAELCAEQTMEALVADGQVRAVPVAAVLTPAEVLGSEHFRSVGALTDAPIASDITLTVPVGPFVIDGHHAGWSHPAPPAGAAEPRWATASSASVVGSTAARPFDGLRILDLGVIVAGGELGRLFADLGADVVKVESAAYPDGLRQTPPGMVMSRSWALTHRNERSLGIDLRHPEGAALFARLVEGADAVFANFKPGTLASLGFSYDRLRAINPRIVLAESSAFGATGPWSQRMGYGPLVRASTGVTSLWTSRDAAPGSFYDATTVFPDHVAARITATAAAAALVAAARTGNGAHVHISQAEAAVNQLATAYAAEAARTAGLPLTEDPAIHGVYPCAGDDEWCVISVRDDDDRTTLAAVLGVDRLPFTRSDLMATVATWTSERDPRAVADSLQSAGVPAAPMNRTVDIPADPQVVFRGMYTEMAHPLFDAAMLCESGPAPFTNIPPADLRPAPMPGEHTREICRDLLGLGTDDTDRLIADGILFTDQGRP